MGLPCLVLWQLGFVNSKSATVAARRTCLPCQLAHCTSTYTLHVLLLDQLNSSKHPITLAQARTKDCCYTWQITVTVIS